MSRTGKAIAIAVCWLTSVSFTSTMSYWNGFAEEMQKSRMESMAHWSGVECATGAAMLVSSAWLIVAFVALSGSSSQPNGGAR